ncbi:MAG: ribulose-phosphate 3-epimerase [Pirellulales bacterium]
MTGRDAVAELRASAPAILPSLLRCDFGNLRQEVEQLEKAGAAALHLDVMDGHFVPNLTYGMPVVEAFRRLTRLPLDVHLMIDNPGQYVEAFREAGADLMTIHVEAVDDPPAVLRQIRDTGAGAGLAINPSTPLEVALPLLGDCDLVLVMSVAPGFGGQAFQPIALEKLQALKRRTEGKLLLEVDGGVDQETVAACATAGADLLVVGSAIFRSSDYSETIQGLRRLARSA